MDLRKNAVAQNRMLMVVLATLLLLVAWLMLLQPAQASRELAKMPADELAATGNLTVNQYSSGQYGGAIAGRPISYTILYYWQGDGPAPNVRVTDQLPAGFTFSRAEPAPSSRSGNTLSWNVGTLQDGTFQDIVIEGTIQSSVAEGTVMSNTVTISGDVTDEEPSDNRDVVAFTVEPNKPDFWILKWGLLEEQETGTFFQAEVGVETTFEIYYWNFSPVEGVNTVLTDTLPAGVAFVSAEPAPAAVSGEVSTGQVVTWELGTVPAYHFDEVKIRVRPTVTGSLTNLATIGNSLGDRTPEDNQSEFAFEVVTLLPPRLLKPHLTSFDSESPVILGPNITFEGLARAGATVKLYEGSPDGCMDFVDCNPVLLGSAVAAANRQWKITPSAPLESRDYYLYVRAELNGESSQPPFYYWQPMVVRVDENFEKAGWEMDEFVIEAGGQETRPGAVGGQSGTVPNQEIRLSVRQKGPANLDQLIANDPKIRAAHAYELRVSDGNGVYTETLPLVEVRRVPTATGAGETGANSPDEHFESWDFIYVHKGFGPGSTVEIWCLPFFYDHETGVPILGLVYVKCHEILIDPAGYVYDINKAGGEYVWPEVPPSESLITNATVTATIRMGDDMWERWKAEATGQVNPQVTDTSTPDGIFVPGYYAFYVPAGQFIVLATAPHCTPYSSPILTVVDSPVFHNVGMRCTEEAQTGVSYSLYLPAVKR